MGETVDFKKVCDNLHTTVFLTDAEGTVLYVNQAYLDRTGLCERQILGKTIFELQEEQVIQCDVIPKILSDGKERNEIGYVPQTDYRGFISGLPIRDENGQIEYVMTTDWDVNTIMEMEHRLKRLQHGESEWESAFESRMEDDELLYISDSMRELTRVLLTISQTDVTVLVIGETGTGKEVVSNMIVKYSGRADKPFVKINCAAIPADLIESELFGYEDGAFTGAKKGGRSGAFEQANGGTILLDEIGELPFQVQAKLLRALQENEIVRIGSSKPVKLDIRVIAATNRNLLEEIKKGSFREDLYYRLNIIQLRISALRDRREDIPFLAGRFLDGFCKKYKKDVVFEPGTLRILRNYEWPGNVRELKNLLERLVILSANGSITEENVKNALSSADLKCTGARKTLNEMVADYERITMEEGIREYGSKKKAAEKLGVERSTFIKKCQRYGI
ncbi:MAG: sigma 54-interacting transcriptional regulator [Eubacterium sp.]|nr:sigma 54-interacting transcriptional regulator [Eubacterium sp.]